MLPTGEELSAARQTRKLNNCFELHPCSSVTSVMLSTCPTLGDGRHPDVHTHPASSKTETEALPCLRSANIFDSGGEGVGGGGKRWEGKELLLFWDRGSRDGGMSRSVRVFERCALDADGRQRDLRQRTPQSNEHRYGPRAALLVTRTKQKANPTCMLRSRENPTCIQRAWPRADFLTIPCGQSLRDTGIA